MADHDDWTADDDAQLRAALTSLRADVEATPLSDVRFVKARGMARRRQRFLAVGAAAAAAVVVAGTVGYAALGRESAPSPVVPADRSSTTTTATAAETPGALPVLTDWTKTLDLTGSVLLTPVKPFGPIECLSAEPGTKVQQEEITRAPELQGGQVRFRIGAGQEVETAAQGIAQEIADCQLAPGYAVTPRSSASTWPRLYSYTAGDAGSGWWAVVQGGSDVTVLQVNQNDRPTSSVTQAQWAELADLATNRLERYGSGSTPQPTGATTSTTSSGPKAIDEDMPVTGPAPVPSSDLFVAASQWTDPLFAKGAQASAGKGDTEDSTGDIGVFCETDDFLAGFGGALGEVEVRAGAGDANVIGHQRVRVDQSADQQQAKASVEEQLTQEKALLAKGCTESDGKVTATKGSTDGTYLLTKKVTGEATGTDYRWVGVAPMSTPGAWTTIVFHGTGDGQGFQGTAAQGFTQLDRLLALARQK